MQVTLAGFSPRLEGRYAAALTTVVDLRVVSLSAAELAESDIAILGDALTPDERRQACQRLRHTARHPMPLLVIVAPLDDELAALVEAQLVDAVIDPADTDERVALKVRLLANTALRLTRGVEERRQALRAVADAAPVLLWTSDEHGQRTFASAAFTRFAGVGFDALRGEGWKSLVHPDDRARATHVLDASVAQRSAYETFYRFRRRDGRWRWLLDRAVPRARDDGAFSGFIGSCTDVTDLRQAQEDLRIARDLAVRFAHAEAPEHVLPACLEAALAVSGCTHGAIYLRDPDGSLKLAETLKVSPALRESIEAILPGSARMQVIERGDAVFFDYDNLPFAPNPVALGEGIKGLAMLPLHNQHVVFGVLLLASDHGGALDVARRGPLEAIAAQMSTALVRLQVEEALARSERLLRTVVEYAPIAIWTVSADGYVGDVWNPAAERLFGESHDQVRREPCRYLAGTNLARVFAGETLRDEPVQRQRADGTLAEILLFAAPLHTRAGVVTSAVVIGIDVTERKQIEARLVQAQKRESLGALAGGLAHDFNNLLTGILGYLDLAKSDLDDPEHPVHELLVLADETARRASQVTRQMLAYSGGGTFVIDTIDVGSIVAPAIPLLAAAFRRATFATDIDSDLPPVEGDLGQLRQLILNLATNGAEALPDGSGTVTIGARHEHLPSALPAASALEEAVPAGDYVVITIADTGTGIDERTRAHMFEPFFSTRFVGRGLGLPAVLGIVRGHRGVIRITSEPGRGTEVRVFLRIAVDDEANPAPPLAPVPLHARRRVLIVDDEPGVIYVASQALRRAEYDVLSASSGRDALACLRERDDIGLVILDLTMPELDGRQTLAALREIRPSQRVVLTSGYTEQEALREFADGALAGFLQKPFGPRTLLDCVARALGLTEVG